MYITFLTIFLSAKLDINVCIVFIYLYENLLFYTVMFSNLGFISKEAVNN